MEPLKFTRLNDLPKSADRSRAEAAVDPSPLLGVWHSTNRATRGIVKLILSDSGGDFTVRAFGACEPSPVDWGAVTGAAFADGVGLRAGVGFKAVYEFGFMRTTLAAYLNKRILVVDAYNTFEDGSGRFNYFSRDHFYQ
jgi:hypothetical protein